MSGHVAGGPGDGFGLPIGTVTFLLTDIEGSTLAWSAAPTLMGPAIARHYEILDEAVAAHGGVRPQEQGEGDSIVAAFLDEAVEFVHRSRGDRGRPTIGWDALTPTERRVADLVRDGLTNAAVGKELLMGTETVKTHLGRVFAKLGVSNRTKLASLVPPDD